MWDIHLVLAFIVFTQIKNFLPGFGIFQNEASPTHHPLFIIIWSWRGFYVFPGSGSENLNISPIILQGKEVVQANLLKMISL